MSDETTSESYPYLFTSTDCMGKRVALKHGTFTEKITKDHPEITCDLIKEGVESAHMVTNDPGDNNRRRYYRMISNPVEDKDNFTNIKVVVEGTATEYDEVVTAYILRDLKGEDCKGRIIYDAGSSNKS